MEHRRCSAIPPKHVRERLHRDLTDVVRRSESSACDDSEIARMEDQLDWIETAIPQRRLT